MRPPCLAQLGSNRQCRVQSCSWALRYQAREPAANISQLTFVAACQIPAKKLDTSADTGSGMIEQPEDRQSQRTLSRPTLTNEAQNFAPEDINTGAA